MTKKYITLAGCKKEVNKRVAELLDQGYRIYAADNGLPENISPNEIIKLEKDMMIDFDYE